MATPKSTLVVITLPTAEEILGITQHSTTPAIELFGRRFQNSAGSKMSRGALSNAIVRDLRDVCESAEVDIREPDTQELKDLVRQLIQLSEVDVPADQQSSYRQSKLIDDVFDGVMAGART